MSIPVTRPALTSPRPRQAVGSKRGAAAARSAQLQCAIRIDPDCCCQCCAVVGGSYESGAMHESKACDAQPGDGPSFSSRDAHMA